MPDLIEIVGATTNTIEVVGSNSTIAEVVNAGPAGPPGDSIYEDLDALAAATVPAPVIRVYVKSYDAAVGPEGGDWYSETGTEPTHDLWVQDAGGRYWELDNPAPAVEVAGAVGNNSTNDAPAVQRVIDYLEAKWGAGTALFGPKTYRFATSVRIKKSITLRGVSIAGGVGDNAGLPDTYYTAIQGTSAITTELILFRAEAFGDLIVGGGVVDVCLKGNNFARRGITAESVSGTVFAVRGEKFTDCNIEVNGDNGAIAVSPQFPYVYYNSGAGAGAINSGNIRIRAGVTGAFGGIIRGVVQNGINLDIGQSDVGHYASVLSGLVDSSTNTGYGIMLRGQKFSRGTAIATHSDNGSGAPRFTTTQPHGLLTHHNVAMGGWVTATDYNGGNFAVTIIDANTFDCETLTYVAETPTTAKFTTDEHPARRNHFGWVAGYAPVFVENTEVFDRPHPHNSIGQINGEGIKVLYEEDANGKGSLDYSLISWSSGEFYETRRYPMRDTIGFEVMAAYRHANVTTGIIGGANAPCLVFSASNNHSTNYATWWRSAPHWNTGTITKAILRYTSDTDGTNTFDIRVRVTTTAVNSTPSAEGDLYAITPQVAQVANRTYEAEVEVNRTYAKGDAITVYIGSNANGDTTTVSFKLHDVRLEFVGDGPDDRPGGADQTWYASVDSPGFGMGVVV